MNKRKLELSLILPTDAAACEACIKRLVASVAALSGVKSAHVDRATPAAPKLCIHYAPEQVRLVELEQLVVASGAHLARAFSHVSLRVPGLRHERQARLLEGLLQREVGVFHASASFGAQQVYVEFDAARSTPERLSQVLASADVGVGAEPHVHAKGEVHEGEAEGTHRHGGPFGERSEMIFSLTCGALTGIGWALSKFALPTGLSTALFVAAYIAGGWFTIREVAVALRARTFEIDFLMLVAAVGAAALGEWFEGALLLFLFTLGHSLEGFAMQRARRAIEALSKLAPETAVRISNDGREEEVSVAALVVGNRLLVKPNTRIPADGYVVSGSSAVNQAPITGESLPVDKTAVDSTVELSAFERVRAESRLFAGTINGPGALTMVMARAATDSTLSRVVKLVSAAETQKSPTQQFTARFERIFVPVILALVVVLLFAFLVVDEPFSASLYRALAVLVAASPCALAIATPSAVLSGVARAARAGVLIKGGGHLEALGAVAVIAFDKTGTLTEGKPKLTDVEPLPGTEVDELLGTAAAVEAQSDHPLATAVVDGAKERVGPMRQRSVAGVEAIVGFGVKGSVDGVAVVIGKPGLFALTEQVRAMTSRLEGLGRTVMVVQSGGQFVGVLGVMDAPRQEAAAVIDQLRRLGVHETVMLTGDNQRVADAVAKQVGIQVARGDLLPEDKVAAVRELAAKRGGLAMVGDGVNDAPAMATSTVGIAMGAGGSDVALETADIALMADDLRGLPFAVGLSRASRRIIRQNLWMSLGMVALLVPATIFGLARIGVAVALHEGSTLLVVVNSLRLLVYSESRGSRIEGMRPKDERGATTGRTSI